MAGNIHTAGVSIPWTNLVTAGVDRDVVAFTQDSLTLLFGISIDPALWTTPNYGFLINFQVTEVATGQRFNNYWRAPLNALPQAPSLWVSMSWARAEFAGVMHAPLGIFNQSGDGMYLYRPYIEILVPRAPDPEFFISGGQSEFAVGEEHFFLCELMN
jgi:hypothetical protein